MWFSTDFTVGVANRPPIKVYSLENFRPISLKLFIGLKKLQLVETISEVAFLMLCLPRYLHFHKLFCKYWNQGTYAIIWLVGLTFGNMTMLRKSLKNKSISNKTDIFIDPFPNNVISSKRRWTCGILYARHYNTRFVYFKPTFWR